ncbi:TasA family protein [Cytobacillus gottheilii]|uniref:TasA family protein n=1 Tax=Cytobacillus gottheilii TaxID=859144 RepID=UPI0009BA96A2|nr:TasA family protein [Cytobacillus gottheilii]
MFKMNKTKKLSLLIFSSMTVIAFILVQSVSQSTAYFTANTANAGDQINTGNLALALGDGESVTSPFTVNNFVPGDYIERTFTVNNTGSVDFSLDVSSAGTDQSVLWSDETKGLQITINDGPAMPISKLEKEMVGNVLASGLTTVKVKIQLPVEADNEFENKAQNFQLIFTAASIEGVKRND